MSESHPTASGIAQPQKPAARRAQASTEHGWSWFVESVMADGDLWAGFVGLTAEQICELGGVKREVRCLDLIGVRDPLAVVLEHGPERCRQVRDWAGKVKRTEGVRNEAGLVA